MHSRLSVNNNQVTMMHHTGRSIKLGFNSAKQAYIEFHSMTLQMFITIIELYAVERLEQMQVVEVV